MRPISSLNFDVIVMGAGAAGLMCAIEAGKRGRRVALLDSAEQAGKKILISGGGRCNFTNIHCRPQNFLSSNPHFAKSALARYTPQDFLEMVERHGISYHEKKLGQLFCDRSAREILDMLLDEATAGGARLYPGAKLHELDHKTGFTLDTNLGQFHADALVIATGGLSIPKMGATGIGYEIARKFGIGLIETRPALVPFVLSRGDQEYYCDLAGVAADVVISSGEQSFEERILITHRGLSGPAALQISSYWEPGQKVYLDLAPGREVMRSLLENKGVRNQAAVRAALRSALPARLADRILQLANPESWDNARLHEFERILHAWPLIPETTEGYAKAEVTAGGIDTDELSAKTMQSRVSGLFFIGEVVDVTGQLGGFNFQWAWASGAAAGRAV